MTVTYVNYFEWCGKENKNPYSEKVAREFHEKKSARLFNNEEMEKFVKLVSAYVSCGCDVRTELQEVEVSK